MTKPAFIGAFIVFFASISPGQRVFILRETKAPIDGFRLRSDEAERKSPLLAAGLSLLLPGMGELYAGNFKTGKYFLAADGALWLTYAGLVLHGNWIKDDARTFAGLHANADLRGKDEQFEVDIGNFPDMDAYNQLRLQNREFDRVYTQPGFNWSWDSEVDRLRYRRLRIQSDEMYRDSRFVIGALVVNRLVSAFSAWRSAAAHREAGTEAAWRLEAELQGALFRPHGLSLKITRIF